MSFSHAMILAAGRGERMRPLSDTVPKPLVAVRGKPLIVHHLEKLARLGVQTVVINLAWLGERVRETLGDGSQWRLQIRYSEEGAEALETGGGILRALPWLGGEPFLVVNADVFTEFDFSELAIDQEAWAQLVLVPNPDYHPQGDFALGEDAMVQPLAPPGERSAGSAGSAGRGWTYSGIGLYRPQFFAGCQPGRIRLLPLLQRAMAERRLRGQLYAGAWREVGTMAQLAALR